MLGIPNRQPASSWPVFPIDLKPMYGIGVILAGSVGVRTGIAKTNSSFPKVMISSSLRLEYRQDKAPPWYSHGSSWASSEILECQSIFAEVRGTFMRVELGPGLYV